MGGGKCARVAQRCAPRTPKKQTGAHLGALLFIAALRLELGQRLLARLDLIHLRLGLGLGREQCRGGLLLLLLGLLDICNLLLVILLLLAPPLRELLEINTAIACGPARPVSSVSPRLARPVEHLLTLA